MNLHVVPKQTAKELFNETFPDIGDSHIADWFIHMMEQEPRIGLDMSLTAIKELPPSSPQQQNETAALILLGGIMGRIQGLLHSDPGDTGGHIQGLIDSYRSFKFTRKEGNNE